MPRPSPAPSRNRDGGRVISSRHGRHPAARQQPSETSGWIESFDAIIRDEGPNRARFLLARLIEYGYRHGVIAPFTANTPYINTIPAEEQPPYPGDREIERRIKNLIRWNAMAMVVRANKHSGGIGGHISTYASLATLLEVGFNHFFRAHTPEAAGDFVYFQGHAAPGVYARAFLEGRLTAAQLGNFRRELAPGGGLSSYPHPWLMPDFWEFPTVSMGLAPISSIYQARFNRYLRARGIADTEQLTRLGVPRRRRDGRAREHGRDHARRRASSLDNLIWVVNCNLQRLDGPVRGNGKIIQELEAAFRGAGWNVIKVIWGDDWDPLLARDTDGLLVRRMGEVVDGAVPEVRRRIRRLHPQATSSAPIPELLALVADLTDAEAAQAAARRPRPGEGLRGLQGGRRAPRRAHRDPRQDHQGLRRSARPARAATSRTSRRSSTSKELRDFRDRFGIPIADADLARRPFYRPPDDSEEIEYLLERRAALGGAVPRRIVRAQPLAAGAAATASRSSDERRRARGGDDAGASSRCCAVS